MNNLKFIFINALIFSGLFTIAAKADVKPIPVIEDGVSIQEPGTFTEGCYYGKEESISDHAPVLYGAIGTWNITAPINKHKIISPFDPTTFFFNHKFYTDSEGNLLNRNGDIVDSNSSETEFLGRGRLYVTDMYIARMDKVAERIKKLFDENPDLMYLPVQEIPGPTEKTTANVNVQSVLNELYEVKDTRINFYQPDTSNILSTTANIGAAKKNSFPDVAIVSRKSAPPLKQELVDLTNRSVAWCSEENESCYVSVHLPFTVIDKNLKQLCSDIKDMATSLHDSGYQTINIAGDFNASAKRMSEVCENALATPNAKSIEFHTSLREKPNHCGSNQGHLGKFNVDVLLIYSF